MRIGDNGPEPAQNCVPCARYIREGLDAGELHREGDVVYNIGDKGKEYIHPKTCDIIYGPNDQRTRAKRLQKGGYVCDPPGCSKEPPVPCASPNPNPSPTPRPSPTPPGQVPPLTESGNYPLPPAGVCPAWFADATSRVGIRVAGMTQCGEGTNCKRVTLWATQKSVKPYCEHSCYDEQGRYSLANCRLECELWHPCQEPQFIDYHGGDPENPGGGIVMQISHPSWGNVFGRLDKQTCDPRHSSCPPEMVNPVHNFNGHDKVVDREGVTTARACMPDGTKCSETTYRIDGR